MFSIGTIRNVAMAAIMIAGSIVTGHAVTGHDPGDAGTNRPAATGSEPAWLTAPSGNPWEVHDANIYQIVAKVADDVAQLHEGPPIVVEDWDKEELTIIPKVNVQGVAVVMFHVRNYNLPLLSVSCQGKTIREILDESCRKAGTYVWRFRERSGTLMISRSELLQDARWLLNHRLGDNGITSMTLNQAVALLQRDYGLHLEKDEKLLDLTSEAADQLGGREVWAGREAPEATARDLLHAVIRVVHSALREEPAAWYRIDVVSDFDRTEGYVVPSHISKFIWRVSKQPALDATALMRRAAEWKRGLDEERNRYGTGEDLRRYFQRSVENMLQKNDELLRLDLLPKDDQ